MSVIHIEEKSVGLGLKVSSPKIAIIGRLNDFYKIFIIFLFYELPATIN